MLPAQAFQSPAAAQWTSPPPAFETPATSPAQGFKRTSPEKLLESPNSRLRVNTPAQTPGAIGGATAREWAADVIVGVRPADITCATSGPAYAVRACLVAQRHVGVGWLCDYEMPSGGLWQALFREPDAPARNNFFVPASRLMVFKQSER